MTTADATFWNGMAETYAAKPVGDPAAFERKIAITRAQMTPNDRIVDVGCGTGSLALMLAPHAREVHGLDVSSEMIRIARGKQEAQGASNVSFHVGALDQELPWADGSLDGVCAYSILHLVEDSPATLARLFRLLKPGGFFVTSTVCLGESWVPYRPILAVMRWLGKAPPVSIVTKARLAAEIEAAGFVDLAQPDVGAEGVVGFMTARKPRAPGC